MGCGVGPKTRKPIMVEITFQSVTNTTTAPAFQVGTYGQTPDGREWSYVAVSTGGLQKGGVAVPAAVTAVDNVTSSTDAMGRIVYITKASAGWTNGAFEGGWVIVDDGTGVGQAGRIIGNTTDTLQLAPEFAFGTALSAVDSDITITQNFLVVKALITSKLQNAVGIAQIAMSAATFGWVLTRGEGVVVAGDTLVVGAGFTTGDNTTGEVIVSVITEGPLTAQSLGRCLVANSAADILTQVWVEV